MAHSYFVVDVFTDQRYAGNPAAVVVDADGLDEAQMQAIAAEFNLSETTFVLPPTVPDADYRFRWFTPGLEVGMCGHATLAGLRALVEAGRIVRDGAAGYGNVAIETKSGTLAAFVESIPDQPDELMLWLELPKPVLVEERLDFDELARSLGTGAEAFEREIPCYRTQDDDVVVFVNDVMTLNGLVPDFAYMMQMHGRKRMRGLCVATTRTLTPSMHVQSRFFAPLCGVDEDPVTGSVHGPLASILVEHGLVPIDNGTAALACVQSKSGGRAGLIYALVSCVDGEDHSVRIAGRTVITMRGTLL